MIRRIVLIDQDKCNGCELCVTACHEGAIKMVDGKATLIRDDYCDGLGDCLPVCDAGAISFIEREAAAYDEEAVKLNIQKKLEKNGCNNSISAGCIGEKAMSLTPINSDGFLDNLNGGISNSQASSSDSKLSNWPVQLALVPTEAPYFKGASILLAADCSAYSYANFHQDFIKGHVLLIACPKLDKFNYSEKLAGIISNNNVSTLTCVRMSVPCCQGLEKIALAAINSSGKDLELKTIVISTESGAIR